MDTKRGKYVFKFVVIFILSTIMVLFSYFIVKHIKNTSAPESFDHEPPKIGTVEKHLYPAKLDDKWGYINSEGVWQIPAIFDEVPTIYTSSNDTEYDILPTCLNKKWGYVDGVAHVFIEKSSESFLIGKDGEYLDENNCGLFPFSEVMAPVKIGNKWGYIDIKGQINIGPMFNTPVH